MSSVSVLESLLADVKAIDGKTDQAAIEMKGTQTLLGENSAALGELGARLTVIERRIENLDAKVNRLLDRLAA